MAERGNFVPDDEADDPAGNREAPTQHIIQPRTL